MAEVYLPETHDPDDLQLASQVALTLKLDSLVVCWSLRGRYFARWTPEAPLGPDPTAR